MRTPWTFSTREWGNGRKVLDNWTTTSQWALVTVSVKNLRGRSRDHENQKETTHGLVWRMRVASMAYDLRKATGRRDQYAFRASNASFCCSMRSSKYAARFRICLARQYL